MFRVSFVILALASALALNGCSQCSQNPAPMTDAGAPVAPPPPPPEAAAPPVAPMEGTAPADAGTMAPAPTATPAM